MLGSIVMFIFLFLYFNQQISLAYLFMAFFGLFSTTWLLLNSTFLSSIFEYQLLMYKFNVINFTYLWSLDFISLWFIWLTFLLWVVCILCAWNLKYKNATFLNLLCSMNLILINVFAVSDIFFFYVFFEALLIPMFLMMGMWGSSERRVYAAYLFFFYTLIGSLFMMVALFFLYSHFGALDSSLLYMYGLSEVSQVLFWGLFFVAMAAKVPMFPIHIWLPEAHVEAPTVGSVLLAGILLKLGLFGLIKFLFPIFPYGTAVFSPFVIVLALIGVIYASISTIVQMDMKKLVAYSSMAHMNFVVLGLFVFNFQGFVGGLSLMMSHGLVSSGLFLCVGVLYERYKTRLFMYLGGLHSVMPLFNLFFFMFLLANMSFPGTSSFMGEFTMLVGIALKNLLICLLSAFTMVFAAAYSLLLYTHVMLGTLNSAFMKKFADLTSREFFYLGLLAFFVLFFGMYPDFMLNGLCFSAPFFMDFMNDILQL